MLQSMLPTLLLIPFTSCRYRGHRVLQTLVRAYFSPVESTGQRYIYTGSTDGTVYIYDVVTGETVRKLSGHAATVRDVSWHPTLPVIATSSVSHLNMLQDSNGDIRSCYWSPIFIAIREKFGRLGASDWR
jgi:WD40 repeat protein